jgi:hypothetical protein
MITPVDSVEIPGWIVTLCAEWYGGQGCMLYAVSSTGGLTIGNRRPRGCDTPQKWYLSIWYDFSVDMGYARRGAEGGDAALLEQAEEWIDAVCERLADEYGLNDWEI